jgi:hypothetical protein
VHALTGCDTTAIFGIGKKSVFKLIKSSSAELSDLSELKDPDLESSICVARKVVAKLYDPRRPRYVQGFSVFYFTSGNFVMCIFTAYWFHAFFGFVV